jgi:hypothetical protein
MIGHTIQSLLPLAPNKLGQKVTSPVTQSFRRVIGPTDATYAGLEGDPQRTSKMLSRLATRMRSGGFPWPVSGDDAWSSDDNDAIPSGYTYFAQLVAHDFVENTAQLPLISAFPGHLQRDYRAQRLVLDTIYGGGPSPNPLPYAIGGDGVDDRCTFRLGHVKAQEQPPFEAPKPPLMDQPARDIPRARCPHLTDRPDEKIAPDSLISDARNDQHLIISQLTAFFHELHNIVFAKVRRLQDNPSPEQVEKLSLPRRDEYATDDSFKQAQGDIAFLQTRKLVAYVYRRVVVQDLLKKLLEPRVWTYYADMTRKFPDDLLDPVDDNRVPIEFSHAAFRFGHVMTRFTYKINDKIVPNPSIKQLLDRSSAGRRDLLPIASNWLVDWSYFFDLGDGRPINFSRRISPYIAFGPLTFDVAVPQELDRDGGLFYRDFIRGYESQVSSVQALINKLGDRRPQERDRSDLLKDANFREHEIGRWLTYIPDHGFDENELVSLSKDPPLLFFVLFEAAHQQGGRRLGILGSTLVAEVFFSAISVNKSVIEEDRAITDLAMLVFGAGVPTSVPALIAFTKSNGGLKEVIVNPAAPA